MKFNPITMFEEKIRKITPEQRLKKLAYQKEWRNKKKKYDNNKNDSEVQG